MKFSVLIPAYKDSFLREAIQSVISQTFSDWELVVLNDCSPYDIESIVNEFNDKRIVYSVNSENVGAVDVVNNWNKCLSMSSGEYVICIGDDDILCQDCLMEYAKYISQYPNVGAFHTRSIIINEKGKQLYITDTRPEKESVYALMAHRMKEEQFIGDFCFKSTTIKDVGGFYYFPLAWGSDDVTAYLCSKNNGIVNVSRPVFCYRKSSINITSVGSARLKIKALNELKLLYEKILKEKPRNDVEYLERQSVILYYHKYFFKRFAEDISMDIRMKYVRCLWWFVNRKKYGISSLCLLYSIAIALGSKVNNK